MKRHSGIHSFFLEMILVLLFLSVSCAAVLQLFSAAHATARRSAELNAAMVLAQSAAETVQSAETPADLDRLFQNGRKKQEGKASVYTADCGADGSPAGQNAAYRVETAVRTSDAAPGVMLEAKITVFSGDGSSRRELFTLNTKKYFPG